MLLRILIVIATIAAFLIAAFITHAQPTATIAQFNPGTSGVAAIDQLVEKGNHQLQFDTGVPIHFSVGVANSTMKYEINDRAWVGPGLDSEAQRRTKAKAETTPLGDFRRLVVIVGDNMEAGALHELTITEDIAWAWTASAQAHRNWGEGGQAEAEATVSVAASVSPLASASPYPYGFAAEPDWSPSITVSATRALDDSAFFDSGSENVKREMKHEFVPDRNNHIWYAHGLAEV